ncbi:MAG TPA: hypothetical protein VFD00_07175 [Thermoclostridium sp.]|nr:hypothetical protein [Thermoclostridium sp.]
MKKILSVILVVTILWVSGVSVFATSPDISAYKTVLDNINDEYSLKFGYVTVDASKITLEEYENKIRKLARQQKELLDYIALREIVFIKTDTEQNKIVPSSHVIKTRTKPTWSLGEYFTITATYAVYDGSRIGICRDSRINLTIPAILANVFLTNISSPTYSVIDGGRTSTVQYTTTVHFDSIFGIDNVLLYTEFYYSDE